MEFSTDGLFASLMIGTIGMGVFLYGKRQQRPPQLLGGIALMTYPYFVSGGFRLWTIGLVIVAAIVVAVQAGY